MCIRDRSISTKGGWMSECLGKELLFMLLSFGPIADGTLLIEERLCLRFLLICIGLCTAFVAVAVVFVVVGEVVFGGENC